jgi:hypothetical protein
MGGNAQQPVQQQQQQQAPPPTPGRQFYQYASSASTESSASAAAPEYLPPWLPPGVHATQTPAPARPPVARQEDALASLGGMWALALSHHDN